MVLEQMSTEDFENSFKKNINYILFSSYPLMRDGIVYIRKVYLEEYGSHVVIRDYPEPRYKQN